MMINIADEKLLSEIESFLKTCWNEPEFDAFRTINEPFFSRYISAAAMKMRLKTGSTFYYWRKDEELLGIAEVQDQRHIALFFISPEKRGQGMGKTFLQKLEWLLMKHKHQIILTVHAYLPHQAFYKKSGFVESGTKVYGMESYLLSMYKRIIA